MKAAVLKRKELIVIEEKRKPRPQAGEVLVKVEAVGVCGSDVHYFRHGRIGSQVATRPLILGHEAAGRIVALGKGVKRLKVGMAVALEPGVPCRCCEWCRDGKYNLCPKIKFFGTPPVAGAYREYLTHPQDFVHPLAKNLTYEEGAMIEPLSVGLHSVEVGQVKKGDTVAIIGAGSIGLSVLQAVRLTGVKTIFISDLLKARLRLAKKFKARHIIDATRRDMVKVVQKETRGRGVDVAFEAVGKDETFQQTLEITRRGGMAVFIGAKAKGKVSLDLDPARRKGLTIKNVRRFRHQYPRAIALAAGRKIDGRSLVTHRFAMKKIVSAFKLVEEYRDGVVKAIIYP